MAFINRKILPPLFLAAALTGCGEADIEYKDQSYNDFLENVEQGEVTEISVEQSAYSGAETIYWRPSLQEKADSAETNIPNAEADGAAVTEYVVGVPANENLYARLEPHDVEVNVTRSGEDMSLWPLFGFFGAIGLFMAAMTVPAWWPSVRGHFKKAAVSNVTFKDVAGVDEALEEIQDILDYMKDPAKYRESGLKVPRALLLTGPPGNGKTLLARAIANECGVRFHAYAGSEFNDSMFMGVGTGKIKAMFRKARSEKIPTIIFIDEFDSLGRKRAGVQGDPDGGSSAGGDVRGASLDKENQVNQLLVELDGFDSNDYDIVLIAATNRPEILDPALMRPGRFDRQAHLGNPDVASREKILNIYLSKYQCAPDVKAGELAKVTYGFSGAQLAGMVNEAALLAHRRGDKIVTSADIEAAKDKIMLGAAFKSRQFSEEEKQLTAYHEAGHALLGHLLSESFPVYKASIVPRGKTLGVVVRAPDSDISTRSLESLKADLAVGMAGRVAEELVFGREKVSTGAGGDLEQVNKIAKAMVMHHGMSSELTPWFAEAGGLGLSHNVSAPTLEKMEAEIEALIQEGAETARRIITERWDDFLKLADALLERETLGAEEIAELIGPNEAHVIAMPNRLRPSERPQLAAE